jgi:hypothetical protein
VVMEEYGGESHGRHPSDTRPSDSRATETVPAPTEDAVP